MFEMDWKSKYMMKNLWTQNKTFDYCMQSTIAAKNYALSTAKSGDKSVSLVYIYDISTPIFDALNSNNRDAKLPN